MNSRNIFVATGAIVRGNVEMKENVNIWFNAVVRAGENHITIGSNSNVQDNCVLHAESISDIEIGENVTIGHGAIVHGCSVGDNSLIGMGAIILNCAKVGKNCIVGAGALVTENMIIPDNSLVVGSPAKVKRQVTPKELQHILENAKHYVEEAKLYQDDNIYQS